jgi:hypothetical protein
MRDQVSDFRRRWNERTEIATQRFVRWLGVASSKFYDWRARYGRVNDHNACIPRDFWLEAWEKRDCPLTGGGSKQGEMYSNGDEGRRRQRPSADDRLR